MHFENRIAFFDYFLLRQKFNELDTYTTTNWQHDPQKNIAAVTLLNPFIENQLSVTIADCTVEQLRQLKHDCTSRYIDQFNLRFATFNKPAHDVVAQYRNWQDLRDIWLVRDGKNMTKASLPLLFDIRNRQDNKNKNIFVTLFIVPSLEFYRFLLIDQSSSDIGLITNEATHITKEAYA